MRFFFWSFFCTFLVYSALCSISNPHLQDEQIHKLVPDFFDAKKTSEEYVKRKPKVIESKDFSPLSLNPQICPLDLKLDWEMEVNAGVVASPVIYPFFRFVHLRVLFMPKIKHVGILFFLFDVVLFSLYIG